MPKKTFFSLTKTLQHVHCKLENTDSRTSTWGLFATYKPWVLCASLLTWVALWIQQIQLICLEFHHRITSMLGSACTSPPWLPSTWEVRNRKQIPIGPEKIKIRLYSNFSLDGVSHWNLTGLLEGSCEMDTMLLPCSSQAWSGTQAQRQEWRACFACTQWLVLGKQVADMEREHNMEAIWLAT